ncbi:MAG TPA: hypothetical protein VHS56_04005 [Candidatus Cybelea sp.]|jgi:hypothetical protein|nr:hypothetical protein [Candidatus Cybelea sp.]
MIRDLGRAAAMLAVVLPLAISEPAGAAPHSPPPRMTSHATPSPAARATPKPQATSKPQETSTVDPQVLALAKEWFRRFQIGDIDRTQLSDTVNKQLTLAMIRREAAQLKPLGDPLSVTFIRSYPISGMLGYDFQLQFKSVRVIEMIAFDGSGKIAGIDFLTLVHN